MGSSYSGEPNLGNERSAGSSRKGKKSSGSDKANKQPQRGLGVAQLEKIRLQTQMGCTYLPSLHGFQEDMSLQAAYPSSVPSPSSYSHTSSSPSYPFHAHSNIMMGLGEAERANNRYGDSQPTSNARIHCKRKGRKTDAIRWVLAVRTRKQVTVKN
ncbi:protein SPEAR3-like isoform X2 [Diospyros lotus]|uniref:protein SPEAR3-like isoform X2 n=1 Tax=Diospyros lotus TaxID=55363 RepID=UPI002256168E|nr:protein SPEAR3-like isoform X2 [Diospyros lotus]